MGAVHGLGCRTEQLKAGPQRLAGYMGGKAQDEASGVACRAGYLYPGKGHWSVDQPGDLSLQPPFPILSSFSPTVHETLKQAPAASAFQGAQHSAHICCRERA